MIKQLKLTKAVIIVILGIAAFIAAKVMEEYEVDGVSTLLAISGILLIIGAFLFLYPILFSKKVDNDGKNVELKPVAKAEVDDTQVADNEVLQS